MTPQTLYARNGDVAIAYETFGDPAHGEPLLLIMGLDFQMTWWPDAFCEQLVRRGLAVARFDNRDTGLSTHFHSPAKESPLRAVLGRTQPAYTGLDMVHDAIAVMDALEWRNVNVMGASMGAGLAQALALTHPERVRSLISLMGLPVNAGPLRTLTYVRFGALNKLRTIRPGHSREEEVENLVEIYRTVASPGFPFPEDWARQVAELSHDRHPRDPMSMQRQLAAGRAQTYPDLSTIAVPTLVISGAADPLIKVAGGRDTAKRIPGAIFVTYPGMGHNLPEELWPDIIDRICDVTNTRSPTAPPTSDAG